MSCPSATETSLELGLHERGIVVSPDVKVRFSDGNHVQVSIDQVHLDPQNLRLWLLFWDKIVWPKNNLIVIPTNSQDDIWLESNGYLLRPKLEPQFPMEFSPASLLEEHLSVYFKLDSECPGGWSLATGDGALFTQGIELNPNDGLSFTLHRALAVPNYDVPLNEILEFKHKRNSELLRLRVSLDSMFESISQSPDRQFTLRRSLSEIDNACADILRASKEWKSLFRIADLNSIYTKVSNVASGYVAGKFFEMESVGAIIGAGASIASFAYEFGVPRIKDRNSPWGYVASYHREVF